MSATCVYTAQLESPRVVVVEHVFRAKCCLNKNVLSLLELTSNGVAGFRAAVRKNNSKNCSLFTIQSK